MKKAARNPVNIMIFFLLVGCHSARDPQQEELLEQHRTDSIAEASIDSAYLVIKSNCDTMMKYVVPVCAVNVLKHFAGKKISELTDSLLKPYINQLIRNSSSSDKPAEKYSEKAKTIIQQLKADCDTSLQKGTYNLVRRQLQEGSKRPHVGGILHAL